VTDPCPFCTPDAARGVFTEPLVYALWDGYPVSPGHALVISTRHVATWFDASDDEHQAIDIALATARDVILRRFRDNPPHGWNIGINAGASAGQRRAHARCPRNRHRLRTHLAQQVRKACLSNRRSASAIIASWSRPAGSAPVIPFTSRKTSAAIV